MESKQGSKFWRKIIQAYNRSGLEQKVFCERHDLKFTSFHYWRYKIRKEQKTKAKQNATTAIVFVT